MSRPVSLALRQTILCHHRQLLRQRRCFSNEADVELIKKQYEEKLKALESRAKAAEQQAKRMREETILGKPTAIVPEVKPVTEATPKRTFRERAKDWWDTAVVLSKPLAFIGLAGSYFYYHLEANSHRDKLILQLELDAPANLEELKEIRAANNVQLNGARVAYQNLKTISVNGRVLIEKINIALAPAFPKEMKEGLKDAHIFERMLLAISDMETRTVDSLHLACVFINLSKASKKERLEFLFNLLSSDGKSLTFAEASKLLNALKASVQLHPHSLCKKTQSIPVPKYAILTTDEILAQYYAEILTRKREEPISKQELFELLLKPSDEADPTKTTEGKKDDSQTAEDKRREKIRLLNMI
eukprot:TRINITY_DN14938_c0_g1::TRINITY_DN14938_c0_g1_i1::g.25843::m.25843 TRINITY_DN14938_c0_g1::TRINITY_DN14938_c0_g1_i1::g.25843  ORF type:complete len:359 (-),score=31.15 TRINITY_DN14938_c0_g1_i1:70-1146(-)